MPTGPYCGSLSRIGLEPWRSLKRRDAKGTNRAQKIFFGMVGANGHSPLLQIASSPSFGGRGLKVRVVRLEFALTLAPSTLLRAGLFRDGREKLMMCGRKFISYRGKNEVEKTLSFLRASGRKGGLP